MNADRTPLKNAVVRILTPSGTFTGLGYRFSEDVVITCAHVIANALSTDAWESQAPVGEVLVDAPFATGEREKHHVRAQVVLNGWLPQRKNNVTSDLAVLRLQEPLHGPTISAGLDPGISLTGHTFLSYGAPKGHEQHLAPLEGRVGADIGNRRYYLSTSGSDYPIEPGCSGAPVLSAQTGTVLGLIAQDEQDPSIRGGFLIPASHLRQLLVQVAIESRTSPDIEYLRTYVKEHLRGTGVQLADQVTRFVDYYAGAPDRPMPFAGRKEAIAHLDGWLAGGGGAFLLLTGAAGLGKSALLLHWMAHLLSQGEVIHLLFLPISIRFDIADELRGLKSLYVQLVGLFSELRFPEGAKPDQEDYRNRIAAGWERIANRPEKNFLLVIDGVDEASSDWLKDRVLPYSIPPNLAIVLAARYKPGQQDGRAWLEEFSFALGYTSSEPLDLQPLSKEAVGEAVAQLGHPLDALPEREGVLDELYHLTDYGDPLLINLWVGQLWKERGRAQILRAAELRNLEPSFTGFLEIWLKEQKTLWKSQRIEVHPDDFQRLLRILALACGPLRLTDLLALMGQLSLPSHWNFEHTRKVLDSAFRLVVPVMDNTGRQGYAFVHPRLGDHFRMELEALKEERRAVPRAYLDWGAATVVALNECALLPEQCPSYLLRHYVAHILEAELVPDEALDRYLLPVLGRGWHQAWYEEEGAYGGYLGDVHRVQNWLLQANIDGDGTQHRLGHMLRCWFIRVSVFSLTENIPPQLILALVKTREWSSQRALRVISQFANPMVRIETYMELAAQLEGESRQQCLHLALESTSAIGAEWDRAHALKTLAAQLEGEPALLRQAIQVASATGDVGRRADILATMAVQFEGEARQQCLHQALEAASAIDDESDRARILVTVAVQLEGEARQQCLHHALDIASTIDDKRDRARALAAVAEQLEGEALQECLLQTLKSAPREEQDFVGIFVMLSLSTVAILLPGEPALLRQMVKAFSAIGDERTHAAALALALAARTMKLEHELHQQCLHQALEIASAIGNDGYRTRTLEAVAEQLGGEPALLPQALEAVSNIDDAGRRASILVALATQAEGKARQQCLHLALATSTIDGEMQRVHILSDVAAQLEGEPALQRQVLEAASTININFRGSVLVSVAARLKGEPDLLNRVLEAASAISGQVSADIHEAVAARLKGEPELLNQVLGAASAIGYAKDRARALTAVAAQLKGEARQQCLHQALDAASAIDDEQNRSSVLEAIAVLLEGKPVLLRQVLEVATIIGDGLHCVRTITAMAVQLEGDAREQCLHQLQDVATTTRFKRDRALALADLAFKLKGEPDLLRQVLDAASVINVYHAWDRACARALAAMAVRLEGEAQQQCLREAVETASAIGAEWHRAEALADIAAQLKGEPDLLHKVLDTALSIGDKGGCAYALATVAAKFEGEERQKCLSRAREAASAIAHKFDRVRVLVAVAKQLDGEARQQCLHQILEAASAIIDERDRARTLAALAVPLIGEARQQCLHQALEAASAIIDERDRARELASVAAQLEGEARQQCLHQALEAASAIIDERDRADTQAAMAERLEGEARQQCLRYALETASAIDFDRDLARDLAAAAAQLEGNPAVVRQALETASAIDREEDRARALAVVAAQLESEPALVHQALEAASAIGDEARRAEILSVVATQLEGETRQQCLRQSLEASSAIGDEKDRARILVTVAVQLEGEARQQCLHQALEAASAIGDESDRASALATVAAQLEGEPLLCKWVLREAQQLPRGRRLSVLLVLACVWNSCLGFSDFYQMLNTMGISNRREWLVFVYALAPIVTKLGGKTAVEDTATAIRDVACWWP